MTRAIKAEIPAIALTSAEAGAALGVSEGFFDDHIRPHLCPIRVGGKALFAVTELQRWATENAGKVLEGGPVVTEPKTAAFENEANAIAKQQAHVGIATHHGGDGVLASGVHPIEDEDGAAAPPLFSNTPDTEREDRRLERDQQPDRYSLEEKVNRQDYALFGFNGTDGLSSRVRELEEAREMDMRDRLSAQRLVLLAALAAVIALIGTIANVIVAVSV